MIDQEHLNKLTSYLVATGHENIDYVVDMYEMGGYGVPPTTYISFVDMEGNNHTVPSELDMMELDQLVINMPTVSLPTPEEEAEFEEQDETS